MVTIEECQPLGDGVDHVDSVGTKDFIANFKPRDLHETVEYLHHFQPGDIDEITILCDRYLAALELLVAEGIAQGILS